MRPPRLLTELVDDLVTMGITQPWRWRCYAAAILTCAWFLIDAAITPTAGDLAGVYLAPLIPLTGARIATSWYRFRVRRAQDRRRYEGMTIG